MDNKEPSRGKTLRIATAVLILLAIAGIFVWKKASETPDKIGDASAQGYPLKITSVNLEEIKAYGIPTVIDFGSDSCIPCKEMAPVLETLNAEWQGAAAVRFMDVWKYSDGVSDFPVPGDSDAGVFHR